MKSLALGLVLAVSVSSAAVAQPAAQGGSGWVYLGAAFNARHCSRLASQDGYQFYQYGAAYVNGVLILNACLGSGGGLDPVTSEKKWFLVTPYSTTLTALEGCARQIEEEFSNVKCFVSKRYAKFECKAKAHLKERISDVGCVRSVKGPYNECVLCDRRE